MICVYCGLMRDHTQLSTCFDTTTEKKVIERDKKERNNET